MNTEPTHCDTCKASLDNGYVYKYQGDKMVGAYCRDCDDKETFAKYLQDKRLRTHLVMDNSMKLYYTDMKKDWYFENDDFLKQLRARCDIALSVSRIRKKIKDFEREVWFKGLQEKVIASSVKGVSAHPFKNIMNNFCVLTYTMCGRTMITIEDDTASVTFVADETSKESRTGFHGIDATEEKAISLIQMAIELYHNQGGTRLVFEEDRKVSMGF